MTRIAKWAAVLALMVGTLLAFSSSAGAATGYPNGSDDVWGLFGSGPYVCSTYDGHEYAYGGALAWSWTPDPFFGGTSCWSTYSQIYTVEGGWAESAGGSPSSSVVVSCQHDYDSYQLACFGLFDCASSWHLVFLGPASSEPICVMMGPSG